MTTTVSDRPSDTKRKPKQKSGLRQVLMPVLIILVGLSVMLYPVVASQWNNYVQRSVADQYDKIAEEKLKNEPEKINQAVEAARAYNQSLEGGPILDPWLSRVAPDNKEYQRYLGQLKGLPAMSQVTIPEIDSRLPVYHGTEPETLQKGLGHLYGSSLPLGGEGTHSVITGHTGITNATLWDNLIDLKKGDAIYVNTFGEKLKYEVHEIEKVLPNETDGLAPQAGQDLLTLITCTPYGINSHRLLVHAHRVPMDPDDLQAMEDASGFRMQLWMWAVLIAGILILLALIWWVRKMMKKAKQQNQDQDEDQVEDTAEELED